ncbi:MAG: DUF4192 domain-containing protein [Propionibacteriaceae bacterium]|jgi:hypothetical protein|nr:DUF4192 domain-containing protein [Propionibacteriaceae bacterium]
MKKKSLISLHTETDVLEAVPALVGFWPQDSLVAVVFRDRRVYVTARWDIAALDDPLAARWLAKRLTLSDDGKVAEATTVFLVGYGDRARAEAAVTATSVALGDAGAAVVGSLVVDGGLWWRAGEPGAGHTVPNLGEIARQVCGRGQVVGSRRELAVSVSAPKGEQEDAMMGLYVTALEESDEDDWARLGARVMSAMESGQRVDEDYVQAGVAMTIQKVRDQVWCGLTAETARRWLPFWVEVLRRTPVGLRSAPLGVTGMVAWVAGQGALMNVCLEEAEKEDPTYPLITLLKTISESCAPPTLWDAVRKGENLK